jgi:hypothetical protein
MARTPEQITAEVLGTQAVRIIVLTAQVEQLQAQVAELTTAKAEARPADATAAEPARPARVLSATPRPAPG